MFHFGTSIRDLYYLLLKCPVLLDQNTQRRQIVKDWLKTLINDSKIPLVIVGTPDCKTIINESNDKNQISRRFTNQLSLENLNFGDNNRKGEFRIFLEKIISILSDITKIKFEIDVSSQTESLLFYASTTGNPADTVNLIKTACFIALENNKMCVYKEDFIEAFYQLTLPNKLPIKGNPFDMTSSEINAALKLNL